MYIFIYIFMNLKKNSKAGVANLGIVTHCACLKSYLCDKCLWTDLWNCYDENTAALWIDVKSAAPEHACKSHHHTHAHILVVEALFYFIACDRIFVFILICACILFAWRCSVILIDSILTLGITDNNIAQSVTLLKHSSRVFSLSMHCGVIYNCTRR